MALIDPDRFAGKPQDDHDVDVSDIMRREGGPPPLRRDAAEQQAIR